MDAKGLRKPISRRDLLRHAATVGAALGAGGPFLASNSPAAAPQPTAAKKRPARLLVGIWAGAWGDAMDAAIGKPFEKQFAVKVEYAYGGSAQHFAKMRAEKGRQTLDVVGWNATYAFNFAKEVGQLVPLKEKAELMPNLKDMFERTNGLVNPEIWTDYNVQIWTYAWTMVYRTDKISPADAKAFDSWWGIFDPKYKGKLGWGDIGWGLGWPLIWLAIMQGTGTIESGKPRDVEKAWELVPRLKDQVGVFFTNDNHRTKLIQMGEVALVPGSSMEFPILQQKGTPLGAWLNLKEGMTAPGDSFSIVRSGDSAREDTAAEFLNFALAPEQQTAFTKFYFTPTNKKAKILPEAESKALSFDQASKLLHVDQIWVASQRDAWQERWNKIMGK